MEKLQDKTRDELRAMAKDLDIKGRGHMTKAQLVEAVANATVKDDGGGCRKGKAAYVENAEIGTIVAFRLPDGRVKSAKIDRRSTAHRKLKLVTQYGAEFIASYDDIVWVRTGKRWPKGVFNLLKGKVAEGDEEGKAEA